MSEPFDHEQSDHIPDPESVIEGPARSTVPRGQHRRRSRRRRRIVLAAVGVVVLVVIGLVAWYEIESHPFGGPGSAVIVRVTKGESSSAVAGQLASKGVVGSSLALKVFFTIHGHPRLEPGGYVLRKNSTFSSVKSVLDGAPNLLTLQVVPGQTVAEVAKQMAGAPGNLKQQFLAATQSGSVRSPFDPPGVTSLEGLLGTGSYDVPPTESATQLLTSMVQRFNQQAAQAGLTTASASALGVTPDQLVTVASIVEKEGYIEKNMPPVARVIYNRLSSKTPLQMDSTVLYSLGQDGGTVTSADLQDNTPYNTYLHSGLTPTPICFPSATALQAALHPPAGPWMFFVVVQKDGTEAFSTTYQEQQANEQLAKSRGLG